MGGTRALRVDVVRTFVACLRGAGLKACTTPERKTPECLACREKIRQPTNL